MLPDEPVIRQAAVEGVDDVVAVAPGIGVTVVFVNTGRSGVAGHVQPMPAPALTVPRGCEQAVHQPGKGALPGVGPEHLDLRCGGRQPMEIELNAAKESELAGLFRRLDAAFFEFGQNEAIDRRLSPMQVFNRGRLSRAQRLEGPMAGAFKRRVFGGLPGPVFSIRRLGPWGSPKHPLLDRLDVLRVKLSGRRHLDVGPVAHRSHQTAVADVAAIDETARVGALRKTLRRHQVEPRHPGLVAVADGAFLGEQRPNP